MGAVFALTRNEEGKFAFTFTTLEGQLILTSQTYDDKETAINRINAVRHLGRQDRSYEPRTADDGEVYLVLKNRKKEVIGQSERYPDSEALPRVIALAKANVRGARFDDLTGEEKP